MPARMACSSGSLRTFFFFFFNPACTCLELVSHLELKCAKMGGEAQAGDSV